MDFYKFDGAGNDFVIIDARQRHLQLSPEVIAHICHRRNGVGADGLMTLSEASEGYDFMMRYYNADGLPAEMCGNGGRCISLFAHLLGLGKEEEGVVRLRFLADDGPHEAEVLQWDMGKGKGIVRLSMREVSDGQRQQVLQGELINTGVPHYVQRVTDLDHFDVVGEGRRLRHHPAMGREGANVDFVELQPDGTMKVRTYERGVEDETWACGTGVTAVALVTGIGTIHTRGGDFQVTFNHSDDGFRDIFLIGPVSLNFTGNISLGDLYQPPQRGEI